MWGRGRQDLGLGNGSAGVGGTGLKCVSALDRLIKSVNSPKPMSLLSFLLTVFLIEKVINVHDKKIKTTSPPYLPVTLRRSTICLLSPSGIFQIYILHIDTHISPFHFHK